MATNPRENSRGEHNFRETSGRLAYVGETSPTNSYCTGKHRRRFCPHIPHVQLFVCIANRKRQDSMFSNLASRLSRTQPPSASNYLQKQQPTLGRRDNSMATNPRENSQWERKSRETFRRLSVRERDLPDKIHCTKNTGGTFCSSLRTALKQDLDGKKPERKLTGGKQF